MFIAILFTVAKYWKQSICPYEGEIINKLWHIKKVKYYSTIARKGLLIHATTWKNVRNVKRKNPD